MSSPAPLSHGENCRDCDPLIHASLMAADACGTVIRDLAQALSHHGGVADPTTDDPTVGAITKCPDDLFVLDEDLFRETLAELTADVVDYVRDTAIQRHPGDPAAANAAGHQWLTDLFQAISVRLSDDRTHVRVVIRQDHP